MTCLALRLARAVALAAVLHAASPMGRATFAQSLKQVVPGEAAPAVVGKEAPPPWLRLWQEDADLADVCFLDAQRGFAVGDRGVLWATDDAGASWRLVETGVTCRLESLCFVDAQNGWAVGGVADPYSNTTRGVLLRTFDGGKSWGLDRAMALPALKKIVFFDERQGWALGDASSLFPNGLFITRDGGRAWQPANGSADHGWLAGDFIDLSRGVAAGDRGALAAVQNGNLQNSRAPDFGLRGLRQVKFAHSSLGWLVGDGGLLMQTRDGGATWQMPDGDFTGAVGPDFDGRGIATRGPQVWIVGSPGSRVLYSPDEGRTWQAFNTGRAAPLTAVHFVDDRRGWAAGALGAILSTQDGGRTWRRQRDGGSRCAWLGVFDEPAQTPFELLALLSAEQGYLGGMHYIARTDDRSGEEAVATAARAHDAAIAAGASLSGMAWRFSARGADYGETAEQILAGWDRQNDGEAWQRQIGGLVRRIRTLRPDIVITRVNGHGAKSRAAADPMASLLRELVLEAVECASDPTRFPEQFEELGLEPWEVKKAWAVLPAGETGAVNLNGDDLASRMGGALSDLATAPRGLILREFRPGPIRIGIVPLVNRTEAESGRDLFGGLALAPGGDARRALLNAPSVSLDGVKKMAQRRKHVQAILSQPGADARTGGAAAQLEDLTRDLDPRSAGDVLFQLGQKLHAGGKSDLAAETMELFARQYPAHPLAPSALAWLVHYWGSGEIAWRAAHAQQAVAMHLDGKRRATPRAERDKEIRVSGSAAPRSRVPDTMLPASYSRSLGIDANAQAERISRMNGAASQLEQLNPRLHAEPLVRFAQGVAQRESGLPGQLDKYVLAVSQLRGHDAWWSCAAAELWTKQPIQAECPKPLAAAHAAQAKPRLDGKLEDAVWRQAKPLQLKAAASDDDRAATVAYLAYDREFLYLAARCQRAADVLYEQGEGPRPRDPDLSRFDRIDFCLDVDRDWATFFKLTVDQRGWAAESCWGDTTWDPQWFVASQLTDEAWTVEAAIPLEELTGRGLAPRTAWSLGVQRSTPGAGFQSWNSPAAPTPRGEGFGLLLFE